MQIDEPPDTQSQLSESADARRANRVIATLVAGIFGVATCCGVAAVYYRHVDGGGSILHPSHAMIRSIGIAVAGICSTAYFSWVAATNRTVFWQD